MPVYNRKMSSLIILRTKQVELRQGLGQTFQLCRARLGLKAGFSHRPGHLGFRPISPAYPPPPTPPLVLDFPRPFLGPPYASGQLRQSPCHRASNPRSANAITSPNAITSHTITAISRPTRIAGRVRRVAIFAMVTTRSPDISPGQKIRQKPSSIHRFHGVLGELQMLEHLVLGIGPRQRHRFAFRRSLRLFGL
jgi:hypothetical protein